MGIMGTRPCVDVDGCVCVCVCVCVCCEGYHARDHVGVLG